MKKLFFIAVFAVISMTTVNAQTFKVGASAGIPLGDAGDFSSFVLGVDAYYYFTNIDSFVEIGANAGFRQYFGKDYDIGSITVKGADVQFLPLAGAARVKLFGMLSGGADIGYAVGINSGNEGGFYFRPIIGFDIADTIELNTSYENISNNGSISAWNVGVLFEF